MAVRGTVKTTSIFRRRFQQQLRRWYQNHRRLLPWRTTRDPYAIAVAEVMLQQTQVGRVIPKYRHWLKEFPTLRSLARAPLTEVMRAWSGLGYNRRGQRLREMARVVIRNHGGRMPSNRDQLQALPGIGQYTSGAIAAFAFRQRVGMVDTNIRRVLGRAVVGYRGSINDSAMEGIAATLVPAKRPDEWQHALMDLGATVCVARRPKCEICPLQTVCRSYPAILSARLRRQASPPIRFEESDRFVRGKILSFLTRQARISLNTLQRRLERSAKIAPVRTRRAAAALCRDGLVAQKGPFLSIAS